MNESGRFRSSVSFMFRMLMIGGVGIFLLILAVNVGSLISEREHRRNEAVCEVNQKWGNFQTLTGPVLTVPFKKPWKNEKGVTTFSIEYLHILPEILQAEVELVPEVRYRGIYKAILYQSVIKLKGTFVLPQFEKHGVIPGNLLATEAYVTVGITDLRGIRNTVTLNWDHAILPASPGVKSPEIAKAGFTVFPAVDLSRKEYAFSADLRLNGSGEFNITPVGKETAVIISSKWGSPSFTGSFLPEKREITADHFRAEWSVQQLNRNFPQSWVGNAHTMEHSSFGVKLFLPVDQYQKITRAVKYAILFIVLTFMAFFLTEIFTKVAVHPVQYTLIGLAIILFYVILLSLSEHITFHISYVIASLGVILLVSAYAKSALKGRRPAAIIGGILAALYLFLYVTLQLEDYALLLGSIGLFVILAVVMYLTRRINWFEIGRANRGQESPLSGKEMGCLENET